MRLKRILYLSSILWVIAVLASMPVMASTTTGATFSGKVRVVNGSYATANNAVPFTLKTQNLVDLDYVDSDLSNVAITDSAGVDVPFMPAPGSTSDWIIFVDDIDQNRSENFNIYTGGDPMDGNIVWFPDTAGMTVDDDATLEPGNDYEININGFFDASVAGTLVEKADALSVTTGGDGSINATMSTTASIHPTSGADAGDGIGTWSSISNAYDNNIGTYASLDCGASTDYSSSLILNLATPVYTNTIRTYNSVSYNAQMGWLQVYYGSAWHSLVGTSMALDTWVVTDMGTPQLVEAIKMRGKAGDTAGRYLRPKEWECVPYPVSVAANGVSSGEHEIQIVYADGMMTLNIDGEEADSTSSSISISDNANVWTFCADDTMLYVESVTVTVSDVLVGSWAWENDETTFTDLSGNGNDATVSFRTTTTDGDLSASIVSFAPISPVSGGVGSTSSIAVPLTSVPADPVVTDVSPSNLTNVPFVGEWASNLLQERDIPEGVITYPAMIMVLVGVIFASYGATKDLGWTGATQFIVSGLFIAWRLLPWPSIFFFGVVLAFCIIKRRTIST